jgi:hypothetical protein
MACQVHARIDTERTSPTLINCLESPFFLSCRADNNSLEAFSFHAAISLIFFDEAEILVQYGISAPLRASDQSSLRATQRYLRSVLRVLPTHERLQFENDKKQTWAVWEHPGPSGLGEMGNGTFVHCLSISKRSLSRAAICPFSRSSVGSAFQP